MTHHDAAHIEEEIRATRAQMNGTIDALKDRLTPGELVDQILPYLREGGADAGRNLARRVRENPLPVALLGASVAWLMMTDASRNGHGNGRSHEPDLFDEIDDVDYQTLSRHDFAHNAISSIRQGAGEAVDAFNERLYAAKAAALGVTRNAAEGLEAFRGRVDSAFQDLSTAAASARSKLARQSERVRAGVGDLARSAKARGRVLADQSARYYDEHPLVIGALGVAAGAVIGSFLPPTRVEERMLHRPAEELRRRAAGAVSQAKDAARNVVAATREAAAREGLTVESAQATAHDLAGRAERVAEEAVQAGQSEIDRRLRRSEGGGGPSI